MASFRNHLLAACGWAPGAGAPAFVTFTLDSANDACEWFFQSPTSDQITTLVVNVASITGAPGNITLALHPPNAAGAADTGTTHASATVAAAAGIRTATIAYTPTRGQNLVLRATCAGATAGNTVVMNNRATSMGPEAGWYPLTVTNGAAAVKIAGALPVFGIRTATKSYGFPLKAFSLIADYSSPAQRGVKFNPPADWGDTFDIAGLSLIWRTPAAAGAFDALVYPTGGSGVAAVQSITRDTDFQAAASSNGQQYLLYFTALSTFTFGTPAYIALAPTTGALRLFIVDFETSGDAAACGGDTFVYISRASTAAAFTEDTTRVPLIDVLPADWTEPVGGGTTNILNRRRNVFTNRQVVNKRRRSVNVSVAVTQTNLVVRPRKLKTFNVVHPKARRVAINPVTINNVSTTLVLNRRRNIMNYGLFRPHVVKRRSVLSTTVNNITTTVLVTRPRRVM